MIISRIASPTKRFLTPYYTWKRSYYHGSDEEERPPNHQASRGKLKREFILSVLQAQPTPRDSRSYLESFTSKKILPKSLKDLNPNSSNNKQVFNPGFPTTEAMPTTATLAASTSAEANQLNQSPSSQIEKKKHTDNHLAHSILSIPNQHTGLVKIQGPFTDRQLESIVDGVIYLKTLGLMSIIILDDEAWHHASSLNTFLTNASRPNQILHMINPSETRHQAIARETTRLSNLLETRGAPTRPFYEGILRLTDHSNPDEGGLDLFIDNLVGLKSAIKNQEIPIITPIAINSSCATICIQADDVVKALAKGLAKYGKSSKILNHSVDSQASASSDIPSDQEANNERHEEINGEDEVDLTPLRLMIINREGGIPSPARNGHAHLSINLASEFEFINETFRWSDSHPTSLANLSMAKSCLKYLPNESSAIIVSHRSPKSLIANLITNKPAHSPSLKHSNLLNFTKDIKLATTPTLIRKGLPIKVIRGIQNLNLIKLKNLLEKSFNKKLNFGHFVNRLEKSLRFLIIAGDYQGAAVVTDEVGEGMTKEEVNSQKESVEPIVYLDKFVVLPSLQGEGIVDFLWGALRDETFGLGNLDALNNNGGLSGIGEPVDLVWRSRTDNPVNRWYFERSNGFIKLPPPPPSGQNSSLHSVTKFSLFWCAAEQSLVNHHHNQPLNLHHNLTPPPLPLDSCLPRKLKTWCNVINQIPSSWI